jgi:hypothetical protein
MLTIWGDWGILEKFGGILRSFDEMSLPCPLCPNVPLGTISTGRSVYQSIHIRHINSMLMVRRKNVWTRSASLGYPSDS